MPSGASSIGDEDGVDENPVRRKKEQDQGDRVGHRIGGPVLNAVDDRADRGGDQGGDRLQVPASDALVVHDVLHLGSS